MFRDSGEILKVSFKTWRKDKFFHLLSGGWGQGTQDGYLTGIEFIVLRKATENAIREIV
jgi:hypothetical protein